MNWDRQGDTHFLDVQGVGRYSIARKAKGSREFALKLNGKSTKYYGTIDELKAIVERIISASQRASKTTFVYDAKDPAQHVGEVSLEKEKKGYTYIVWHSNYGSFVKDEDVNVAPADARIGDKLAMPGYGRIS